MNNSTANKTRPERKRHILTAMADGYSKGESLGKYQAYVSQGDLGAIVGLSQSINGEWHPTGGQWYLKTLLDGGGISDDISIDYGQQWSAGGMRDVIFEAAIFCAGLYSKEAQS
jgi:hypothetical protein